MPSDRPYVSRHGERFGLALPITFEGEEGSTHDVSASGVLLELPCEATPGDSVGLTLHCEFRGEAMDLQCTGRVVRVERHAEGFNIAVKLSEPLFEARQDTASSAG